MLSNWIYEMDKKKIFKMRPVNPPEFLEDGIIIDRDELKKQSGVYWGRGWGWGWRGGTNPS